VLDIGRSRPAGTLMFMRIFATDVAMYAANPAPPTPAATVEINVFMPDPSSGNCMYFTPGISFCNKRRCCNNTNVYC